MHGTRLDLDTVQGQVFELCPEPMAIVAPDGTVLSVNRRLTEWLGCGADDLVGKSIGDQAFLPPQSKAIAAGQLRRRLSGEEVGPYEIEVLRKDGETLVGRITATPIRDSEDGSVIAGLAVISDVTARRCAEERLRRNEEYLRKLFANSPDYIMTVDREGVILFLNRSKSDMAVADIVGTKVVDYISPEFRDRYLMALHRVFEQGVRETFESQTSDAKWWTARLIPLVDGEGTVSEAMQISSDLTEAKLSAQKFQETQAQRRELERIVTASPAVVFRWRIAPDWPTEFVSANVSQFGYAAEQYTSGEVSYAEMIVAEDMERLESEIAVHLEMGVDQYSQAYRLRTKSGEIRWVEDRNVVIRDEQGAPTHVQGIVIDITERKRFEQELEASQQRLRSVAGRLVSAREDERTHIAHEIHDELGHELTILKMDLARIAKYLERHREAVAPEDILGGIRASMDLVDRTIRSVRQLATDLRPPVLDLGLPAAIEWQAQEFQNRTGIRCDLTCDAEDIPVSKERATALFRVFQEVLTNVARHAEASQVDVVLRICGERIVLQVADNGRGIEEDEATGAESLGLISMRERVEWFGGTLVLTGKAEQGTSVAVELPVG